MKKQRMADMACLVVALVWGSGFIASQWAIDARMDTSVIMAGRFSLAALILLVLCAKRLKNLRKKDVARGSLAAVFMFVGFYTQLLGQARTTVAHSAFLTMTNVLMVPFFVWLLTKRRPPLKSFVLAGVMLVGAAVLTLGGGEGGGVNVGDALTLLCAVGFAMHVAYLGVAVHDADPMLITLVQMVVAAVLSLGALAVRGGAALAQAQWRPGLAAILYLGLLCTCLCYILQTTAQKYTSAPRASILMSCEGLFGSVFAVVLGYDSITPKLVAGGAIITAAVILLELDFKKSRPGEDACGQLD